MSYLLKFSGDLDYTFGQTWYPADRSQQNVIPSTKLARAHGAHQLDGYKAGRRLVIRGGLIGPGGPIHDIANLRDEIDDLLAALNSGPGLLYFGESDRVFRCCLWENFNEPYDPTQFDRILSGCEITFLCPDAYRYEITSTTDTWSSPSTGATHSVTVGGNAPTEPEISITVGGAGSQAIAFTLENNTTGESFTLSGTVTGGDVIVVECQRPKSVLIGTTDERTLFEGQFLTLKTGTNTLEVTITSGSITSISTVYTNRWH